MQSAEENLLATNYANKHELGNRLIPYRNIHEHRRSYFSLGIAEVLRAGGSGERH